MEDHYEDPFNTGYCVTCHQHAIYGESITRAEWPCEIARLKAALSALAGDSPPS